MLLKGHLVSQLSGRSGSVVFAHNRGGPYARDFTPPVDPESARQITMRTAMTNCSARWAALTTAERSLWDAYGLNVTSTNRLGDSRHSTGRSHYFAWYLAYTGANDAEPFVDVFPSLLTIPSPPILSGITAEARVSTFILIAGLHTQIDDKNDPAISDQLATYVSPPLAITRNFWKQEFPAVCTNTFTSNGPFPKAVLCSGTAGWDVLGDEACFTKFRYIRKDGRLSPFVYTRQITFPSP